MPSVQEQANALARELKQAMKEVKVAQAKARRLSEDLAQALVLVKVEAEAARTVLEYPSGRYECAACGQVILFTEPTHELPACDSCGGRKYVGHEPTVTTVEPPPPRKYPAGMYSCACCGARIGVVEDTDETSPCELCGVAELKPLQA